MRIKVNETEMKITLDETNEKYEAMKKPAKEYEERERKVLEKKR